MPAIMMDQIPLLSEEGIKDGAPTTPDPSRTRKGIPA